MKKVILANRPYEQADAQYNFDPTIGILGAPPDSNVIEETLELFSTVESKILNVDSTHPDWVDGGTMWNYKGSQFEIDYVKSQDNDNPESDGGRYNNVAFSIYMYDSHGTNTPTLIELQSTGSENYLRDLIGEGNSLRTDGNRIGYWSLSEQKQDASIGDITSENKACYGTCGPNWNTDLIVRDWPVEPYLNSNDGTILFYGDEDKKGWNTSINNWTDYMSTNLNSSFFIVVRSAGDERETLWPAGTKTDERDRSYVKVEFEKRNLIQKWKESNGGALEYGWREDSSHSMTVDYWLDDDSRDIWNEEDDYGDTNGHGDLSDHKDPINLTRAIKLQVTYPTWTPDKARQPINQGGWNSMWTDKNANPNTWWCVKSIGLNPTYNLDHYNWPSSFYNTQGSKWFRNSDIVDWRPISTLSTYYQSNETNNKDLQSYYTTGTQDSILASAPNNVKLTLDLIEEPYSTGLTEDLEYIDLVNNPSYNKFKYWYFVVNWDWQDGDKGGGSCESEDSQVNCLDELGLNFPESEEDLVNLSNATYGNNTFNLASFTSSEGFNNYLTHQYSEPGQKIIKVVVFNTIDYDGVNSDYDGKVRQAVRWKLLNIKVNLTDDASSSQDFSDVGGTDFTFLPYPEQLVYNGDNGLPEHTSLNGNYYKSSHPMIGGLSTDSQYVKDLEIMEQTSPSIFSKKEGSELRRLQNSLNYTPGKVYDELGSYKGMSDISQVRYFNGEVLEKYSCTNDDINTQTNLYSDKCQGLQPEEEIDVYRTLDIYDLLNINPIIDNNVNFYDNFAYWDGDNNGFPIESSITDIFINGNEYLNDYCVMEFNCWNLAGGSILDSSGNGNKGILVGDYSIKKENKNQPTVRASNIELPKLSFDKNDGAF